ncbi:hypothetical protein FH972_026740 [Carpinus fangiana]|uniref:Uncharacterized protein n=1 Tax=Carpinus fangiana TaxID=176857 RepID=A0A5N6L4Z1_9ROSI|nr:hypothetical protein FH972_026740 [Carpinus fangiana]
MEDSVTSQVDIQALITETKALGWDNSDQLEIHDGNPTSQEGFAFIAPLFMEVLAPNKYLFTVPFESNFTLAQTKGKGKTKWYNNEDDIPLAQLKKSRYGQNVSIDTLTNLDIVAQSLTELQNAPPPKGPIQTFMVSSLHKFQGQIMDYISTASFVATPPMNSHHFFKATRGRRHVFNDAMNVIEAVSLSTQAQVLSSPVDPEILEESPVRPPPHV